MDPPFHSGFHWLYPGHEVPGFHYTLEQDSNMQI
nr:MAG TPA: hypothetical protein [Caudoviricetes sp.]